MKTKEESTLTKERVFGGDAKEMAHEARISNSKKYQKELMLVRAMYKNKVEGKKITADTYIMLDAKGYFHDLAERNLETALIDYQVGVKNERNFTGTIERYWDDACTKIKYIYDLKDGWPCGRIIWGEPDGTITKDIKVFMAEKKEDGEEETC